MQASDVHVLVVDDDPAMRALVVKLLSRDGFAVRSVADGNAALEAVAQLCPDIVVSDWEMPHLSGLDLCRRLREMELPHYVYILLMTGRAQPDDLIQGLEAGADEFLPKPIAPSELKARIHSAFRMIGMERELRRLAKSDPLTGVLNRRSFEEHLEREFQHARRHRRDLACVMLDIDFFKRVNDTYGHPAGDQVLRTVARVLQSQCRADDYLGRLGGEEFCILLTETNESGAAAWAERARVLLAQHPIATDNATLSVTSSFGVCQCLADMESAHSLVDLSDQALLVAKQSGRDRVVRASSLVDEIIDMSAAADGCDPLATVRAHDLMTSIVHCLAADDPLEMAAEFFLRFRVGSTPVVDQSGKLVGILSEKDLLNLKATHTAWDRRVGEIMKTNVVCYDESTPAKEVYAFLCRVSIRRVVVLSEGRPIGIISRQSLLRWFLNWRLLRRNENSPWTADIERHSRKEHLGGARATSAALAHSSSKLTEHLQADLEDDIEPRIVGEVTRMQELMNDLLAFCQRAYSE
jgi:diguanylate cyclase (GGDEF)-like protein